MARLLLTLAAAASADCRSQQPDAREPAMKRLDPVTVTATRIGQPGFALPLSVDVVGREAIQHEQALANPAASLSRVPGIVAQNRQNHAQDLQISSRGFGARATFGVRGVRLYVDGIPATMPDGQGQTSHIDLASAERIEVLRGPFSALYGNSSGGVIAVQTEDGRPGAALSSFAQLGRFCSRHAGLKASGQQGGINYVLSASRFDTDGYRAHSAATRNTLNAKLRVTSGEDSSLTLVANAVRLPQAQDPLGQTRAQFQSEPRAAVPAALQFNTRKSVEQQQIGAAYTRILNRRDSFHATVYGGHRATGQFLAVPVAAQQAPTSAGGVVDLARRYGGIDLRWTRDDEFGGTRLQWSAGLAVDHLDEERRGHENFAGAELGVRGRLRRDEDNAAYNIDQYLQAQWEPQWEQDRRWLLLAGVRNSTVRIRSEDRFVAPGNGDDSGSVRYHALNPVLGASFLLSGAMRLYASYGTGFETPTLNELSYRAAGGGLNFALRPAKSRHLEAGLKLRLGGLRANVAALHIETDNELAVQSNAGGRAVFQNVGRTRRDGIEAALEASWSNGAALLLSGALLHARYADAFCSGPCAAATQVRAGNRMPGVPRASVHAELSWRHPADHFSCALEARHVGKVMVDDLNSDAAPGHFVTGLRAAWEQRLGRWTVRELLRIDNLAARRYAGSVIVNESNRRFFEAAPQRSYLLGVTASHSW